jgi:hypothetical protein
VLIFGPLSGAIGLSKPDDASARARSSVHGLEEQRAGLATLKMYALVSRFSLGGSYINAIVREGGIASALRAALSSRDAEVREYAFELIAVSALDSRIAVEELCADGRLGPAVMARIVHAREDLERGDVTAGTLTLGRVGFNSLAEVCWALQALANTLHWETTTEKVRVRPRGRRVGRARRRGSAAPLNEGATLPLREALLGDGGARIAAELTRLLVALDRATMREQVLAVGDAVASGAVRENEIPAAVMGSVASEATARLAVELLSTLLDGGSNTPVLHAVCENEGALAALATMCTSRPELQHSAAPLLLAVLCNNLRDQAARGDEILFNTGSSLVLAKLHSHLANALMLPKAGKQWTSQAAGEAASASEARVAALDIADVEEEVARASFAEGISDALDALDGLSQVSFFYLPLHLTRIMLTI